MKAKLLILGLSLAIMGILAAFAAADEVPRMTKEQLKALLDAPDVVVLDVRRGKNWKESEKKIRGAVRENPKRFKSWAHKYPKGKTLVLYCA
jgi:rhodanese-related sulfurtransferase